ncbi:MAG: bifunctional [glutamate--ammonia ligase]-adenylyl-L-tyrosine phosphorylase/[glutamate--ammonia-ligase] adenylyltransferase [Rhodospirillaceae bacterium]|jgi:glutamate-ammonia-ligase adenylyltransferase|nr:bifunctional [glutamate--ammonia ligase]-adenylyl-L-tyrosine phosphorylase/[glutamate--ammonia-ligase] adenylyltransferase [Rhodospirillaceae bacterium]
MQHFCFAIEQSGLPITASSQHAALGIDRWRKAVELSGDAGIEAFADSVLNNPVGRRLLEAIFGNSPFLTHAAVSDPGFTQKLLSEGPDSLYTKVIVGLQHCRKDGIGISDLGRFLRIAKRRVSLLIAVADITGVWSLERVTHALSDFAEASLGCAVQYILKDAAGKRAFNLIDSEQPEKNSGFVVIGMGKLGARELNYSSDIDLIVLYDHEKIHTDSPEALQNHMVRMTRNLVRLMDERTVDGYVFRTDMRLRPDPSATPLAISLLAAETYYESLGQNWERAAMIKARPVAGDRVAGEAFLDHLKPFVWRKNLDFAAIQDIHSIKRQINAHRGGSHIALAGHNIKLGRGGIREIEFFAQTQQLIWGGREPKLRSSATVEALLALAEGGQIAVETGTDLIDAYGFLRRVEHRLQMIDDEQTQILPQDEQGLAHLAAFLGYDGKDAFVSELLAHLRRVEAHYAELFENAPPLGASEETLGNLVFTGSEADPDTIRTIKSLGFVNPEVVDTTVRGWHHGHCRATRSSRSRGLLTELMPVLLKALANTPVPDAAFLKFDEFLANLPAGVQLFSMFYSNPQLLDLLAEIIGLAPRLAEHLSRRPSILESVLSADFFGPSSSPETLDVELDRHLVQAGNLEDVLNISRRWANDRRFQMGVQKLRGHIAPAMASRGLSNIAETALKRLLPRVEEEFIRKHGRIPGSEMVIIAMGKLGGREMTSTSDLDLIFVYTTPDGHVASEGPQPLPPSQYFARLSQRLINAVTAHTAEGRLYEVDMRLRPSGKAGPIASSFEAFVQYHRDAAWTWEHMALTRARVIAGPASLGKKVKTVIRDVLTKPRDENQLVRDIAEMRECMDGEHHTNSIWEVKHMRGGLVDVEFIAQYLLLKYAHAHPEILSPNTWMVLNRIRDAGLIESSAIDQLTEALTLWQTIQGTLLLAIEGRFDKQEGSAVPEGLRETLAELGGAVDFAVLQAKIETMAKKVHVLFVGLIENPAKELMAKQKMGGQNE